MRDRIYKYEKNAFLMYEKINRDQVSSYYSPYV